MKILFYFLVLILMVVKLTSSAYCDRTPEGVSRGKNMDDVDKYVIEISGDPTSYIPEKTYTVTLRHNANSLGLHMFRDFMLSVEREDVNSQIDSDQTQQKVGVFKSPKNMIYDFSRRCENTIQQVNSIPKSSIQVDWIAPPTNSGCVAFRATVAESKENWYGEEGSLTKVLCESPSENEDEQPAVLERCCACEEAKYELVFEGLWTRNTHPKDYPSYIWITKFGEIVGASHSNDESFWKYEDYASENIKALGERGDTSGIEMELKEKMGKTVRTVIKANSLRYPNITGKTFAFFRVDRENHLVSIVSKITPSPDWIVGVSNFELCQDNCSWVDHRVLNLYPWDIGTDDGPSYRSVNQPASSPSTIQKIKSDDPSSPFFDEKGNSIKPFAKLYFTRLKTYQMECSNQEPNRNDGSEVTTEEAQSEECRTKPWSSWSACSKTCGEGLMFRKRELRKPENEDICSVKLVDHRTCTGKKCKNGFNPGQLQSDDPRCELTQWSAWSSCSTECGNGTMTRDKKFKNPQYAAQCANNDPAITQQNEMCNENSSSCPNDGKEETDCSKTNWGPWTPCSVTCGNGNKTRLRMPDEGEEQEAPTESECKNMETVTCYEPLCENEGTTITDFGGITSLGQLSTERIFSEPYGPVINCVVSDWSIWGPCELIEGNCGKGYVTQHRQIQQHAMNGGKPCPIRLMRKRRCLVKCHKEEEEITTTPPIETTEADTSDSVDCVMSHWSQWSPCSSSCGSTAVQQRTRNVKVPPGKNGKPCGIRLEQKLVRCL
ncbi:hypothetical protein WA026_009571 [Henosepilachna vigintioctopunctata]|uniref:Spondin-1 n=1 Tax=Henosepilachna vigintioctopunctata TaxID=420089 RepID=A0AAW1TYP2_9CUCU